MSPVSRGRAHGDRWASGDHQAGGEEACGVRVMRANRHGQRSEGARGWLRLRVASVRLVGLAQRPCTGRADRVQRGRALLRSLTRREIGAYLRVRDSSTISHRARRAEARLTDEPSCQRQAEQVMKHVRHTSVHA